MEFDREQLSRELLKDFEQKGDIDLDSEPGIPVKILLPLIVVAAIGFGVYAWYSDKIAISHNDGSEVPLVRADKAPVRSRPDDPGGMHIANRDKLIYDTISSEKSKELPKVVQLLPKAEEPVSREVIKEGNVGLPDLFDDVALEVPKEKPFEKKPVKTAEKAPEEVKMLSKQELMSKDVVVESSAGELEDKAEEPVTVEDIKNVPVPTVRVKQVIEPKKSVIGYKIQLGSYRTEGDVEASWKKIQKKHTSLLGNVSLYTQKADLGDKGVFYRLQVGSLKSESEARAVCQELIKNKQGCFVVKK